MAGDPAANEKSLSGVSAAGLVSLVGAISDNGPQLMLIQLLPSSTVAPAVRLKIGVGTLPSKVPGGTWYQVVAPASGGIFEPLQYCFATTRPSGAVEEVLTLKPEAPPGYPAMLV